MGDPGDEHVDIPVVPRKLTGISLLLAQWEEEDPVGFMKHGISNETLWNMMMYHEQMQFCCEHCRLEANGEDGS